MLTAWLSRDTLFSPTSRMHLPISHSGLVSIESSAAVKARVYCPSCFLTANLILLRVARICPFRLQSTFHINPSLNFQLQEHIPFRTSFYRVSLESESKSTLRICTMARSSRGRGTGGGRQNDSRDTQISKALTYLLRHKATKESVKIDEGGWANLADVVSRLRYASSSSIFSLVIQSQYVSPAVWPFNFSSVSHM